MSRPLPVAFPLSRRNRNSVAAVLAVLEADCPGAFEPKLLRSALDHDGRGLLAWSFASPERDQVARQMAQLSARWGDALLACCGGPHPSGAPEDCSDLGFRWVFAGEAGPSFSGLVSALADGQIPPHAVSREGFQAGLDAYWPWPASGALFSHIELTRGCPMACGFCQTPRLFGRRQRHRSLEQLGLVFRHAVSTGHRYTRFVAANAFGYGSEHPRKPDPRAVESLLKLARDSGYRELYFGTFPSEVRPESVTPELLSLVRDHCDNRTLAIGMQSGSEAVLKRLKRGHTAREAVRAIAAAAASGFTPKVDFIFGLPGETETEQAETREVVSHLVAEYGAEIHAHVFTPLPGTPLAHAPASPIAPATRELMERLAGGQRATGVQADWTAPVSPRPPR